MLLEGKPYIKFYLWTQYTGLKTPLLLDFRSYLGHCLIHRHSMLLGMIGLLKMGLETKRITKFFEFTKTRKKVFFPNENEN